MKETSKFKVGDYWWTTRGDFVTRGDLMLIVLMGNTIIKCKIIRTGKELIFPNRKKFMDRFFIEKETDKRKILKIYLGVKKRD